MKHIDDYFDLDYVCLQDTYNNQIWITKHEDKVFIVRQTWTGWSVYDCDKVDNGGLIYCLSEFEDAKRFIQYVINND